MLLWLSCIDGEQFMGDQEYYFDEQGQQERFIKGKYSIGLSLFPINLIHLIHVACVTLIGIPKNWTYTLSPMGYALDSFASAQLNHDLVTWQMVYAINIKIWIFSNLKIGAGVFS